MARRLERLAVLKAELEQAHGSHCVTLAADLSLAEDVERVYREATQACEVYAVILNAGITHFGPHLDLEWQQVNDLIATHVIAWCTWRTVSCRTSSRAGKAAACFW